ncbi:hypothetical protein ZEAMMB73_Zm00001d010176 [Zea mays]|uniref:Uncharacterized protein n=1 Tax=Zea mays TaxID=4577 RepID=A0A1D6FPM8_MAIZE|nr:hypothetical protein ZEAMMB73_Zm00001d010176 [Zea mays]
MDGKMLLGRKIAVVFVEENRKKPSDMRAREKISGRGRSYDGRLRSRSPGLYDSPRVDHGPKAEATRQHFSESTIQGYLNVYYVGIPKSLMSEVSCEPMNLDVGRADQCAGAYVV